VGERPRHELAEVFRRCRAAPRLEQTGPAWSWEQRAVVDSIIACRTERLGGHVDACDACGHTRISYNSCRNRHCPKCQGSAQAAWLEARQAEVLPVPYAHVVFTIPQALAPLALQNPRVVYDLLLRTSGRTLKDVALNPKHLGARIGFFAILHTWGQTLVHHPHVHCVVPAGGLSEDGRTWCPCRPGFFLPVRVLSRLFRGRFIAGLWDAFHDGRLEFHGILAHLRSPAAFARHLNAACGTEWVVYAKPPFNGPKQVLTYLARYTHRVAISNHRLLHVDDTAVRFRYKDYRGYRIRSIQLPLQEFARRFLLHVLPKGFVRIRYYGILANANRARLLACSREALAQDTGLPPPASRSSEQIEGVSDLPPDDLRLCPHCRKGVLRCIQMLGRPPPSTKGFQRVAS
jgi:putative transposase/transposase-like zinc-binding protein